MIEDADIVELKQHILDSNLTISALVSVAWSAASVYRDTDKRGGAKGARIALEPQNNWEMNRPEDLNGVLESLKGIRSVFFLTAPNY